MEQRAATVNPKIQIEFSAPLWRMAVEEDRPAWFFVTVPDDQSDQISDLAPSGPGFGSVKVRATIGATTWDTSLFPSKQAEAYVLPVKRLVRDSEKLTAGDPASVTLTLWPDE